MVNGIGSSRQGETTRFNSQENKTNMMNNQNNVINQYDPRNNRRQPGSGLGGVKSDTGHDEMSRQVSHAANTTVHNLKLRGRTINIGTWNVRGLIHTGKLNLLEKELVRQRVDICGLCETHWKNNGHFQTDMHTIYVSGNEHQSRNGTAFLVNKNIAKYVKEYEPITDRIIKITFSARPFNFHIIQVYMPTSDASDEETDEVYQIIETHAAKIPCNEPLLIIGDFNSKVGTSHDSCITEILGKYGLGDRNERGERFIQFALENSLSIMNTMFKQHPRRLSTWTSPDKKYKNQIDYVLIRKRWRSFISCVKAKPGADCDSDHKLLLCKFKIKLHVVKKAEKKVDIKVVNQTVFKQKLIENPQDTSGSVNDYWIRLRDWIADAAKSSGKPIAERKKYWISDETLKMVDERRNLKQRSNSDSMSEIRQLDKKIKHACTKDKNNFIQQTCVELEQHAEKCESRKLFQTVKFLSREFKTHTQVIQNESQEIIRDAYGIAEVWRLYCMKLFDDNSLNTYQLHEIELEPSILKSEVELAISKLNNNKAPGSDGITAETIKAMEEIAVDPIYKLCTMIWNTMVWPEDWVHSVFVPIYKKGSPTECGNYRTVALIPHASKVMLHIIHNRLRRFVLPEIAEEQCGFVPGKGTREQILNVRQIIEKVREFNVPAFFCFVDYTKAFDSVKWHLLWDVLQKLGVPNHLIQLIKSLYDQNTATVRVNNVISDTLSTKSGTRQGCILSPTLFNAYTELIMREVLSDWDGGISVGGRKINNLRYADDMLIIASTSAELEDIMTRLSTYSNAYGLQINMSKTKVMIIDRLNNNQQNVTTVAGFDVVSHFNYLGSIICNNGECANEIKRRLSMARAATSKLTKIWKDRRITKRTKLRLVEALIFPIATYASETWTIKQAERKRIESFEMWVYRRILRISWTQFRTNVSILQELNINDRLLKKVNRSYLKYFGHIARREGTMERLMVDGKVEGRRGRGRSPTRWCDQLKPLIGTTLSEALHLAEDREVWRDNILRSNL